MKVTIKRIGFKHFVKWHTISSLTTGIFAGAIYSAITAYFYSGEILLGYLFFYIIGFPVIYFILGLLTAGIFTLLYNSLNDSLGSLEIEVATEDEKQNLPPAPPTFEN